MHWTTLLIHFIAYLLVGVGSGLLSGLIGAGGGLVIVPGLLFVFRFIAMTPGIAMHVTIGTSLATMVALSMRSLLAHMKHHVPFVSIYKQMAKGVVVGVIVGGIAAHFIHSNVLSVVFGIFVFVMAYRLLTEKSKKK